MTTETEEHWESAVFADFKAGDRIRFWTNDNGFDGMGEVWRTGTVRKVTAKTIMVDCDRNLFGHHAIIRLATWYHRCPMKIKAGEVAPDATQALLTAQAGGQEIVCTSVLYSDHGRRMVHRPRCSIDSQPWVPMFDQFNPDAHHYTSAECAVRTAREETP